ncbi:hypothetical protein [Klenkia taihuensis]|uniref:Serpin (Serine protease inhibitor) n=1 Tax=Klenkia taihuensis TaxID=1225127 RepID=A0A1I1Q8Z2_9ACTN|nr:hypothetical protein [Klenkia taihuensis]GHE08365.1 hypothetical protein GCM10011381_08860 [Klenkia taihuensis]SFD14590.1 hypothetical protein SAMN05661030_2489 [Klenkia taihuensis]
MTSPELPGPAADESAPRLPDLISRYADLCHREMADGHWVASPLGAWLLLAIAAPAAPPGSALQARIGDVLGLPVPEAVRLAGDLVSSRHDVVRAASAAWADLDATTAALVEWGGALPAGTTFDTRVPTQEEADA